MIFLKDFIELFLKSFIFNISFFKKDLFLKEKNLRRKIKRRRIKYLKNLKAKFFKVII